MIGPAGTELPRDHRPRRGRVSVEERAAGVGSAINFMHGSTEGFREAASCNSGASSTDLTTGLVLFPFGQRRGALVATGEGPASGGGGGGARPLVSAALMLRVWIFG